MTATTMDDFNIRDLELLDVFGNNNSTIVTAHLCNDDNPVIEKQLVSTSLAANESIEHKKRTSSLEDDVLIGDGPNSPSDPELSDTESAHRSISMSSLDGDGPHLQEANNDNGNGNGEDDDDEDEEDDRDVGNGAQDEEAESSECESSREATAVTVVDPMAATTVDGSTRATKCDDPDVGLTRSPDENDQEYARRVRKHNYLSLAQEFADRKAAAAAAAAVAAATDNRLSLSLSLQHDEIEMAKNVRNNEKNCPTRRSDSKADDLIVTYPAAATMPSLQLPTVNQSAIHHHHQRSLVTRRCPSAEPLVTSPKNVRIPRRISFKTPVETTASGVASAAATMDLPANVAKMAAAIGPVANAAFQRPTIRSTSDVGLQQAANSMTPKMTKKTRRHTSYLSGDGSTCASSVAYKSDMYGVKDLDLDDLVIGRFDVYNIETTMPTIDWVAMEEHLAKAAKERDIFHKHHRNNREEIRRKLAMGSDNDDYYGGERTTTGRKPSLQTRLQSGMNLQICFMNETAVGEQESTAQSVPATATQTAAAIVDTTAVDALSCGRCSEVNTAMPDPSSSSMTEKSCTGGFVSRQAKLQAEARMALAQAKRMAHMQMEVEKQRKKKKSPIAEMVGIPFPDGRRKVSRHALCEMNVAQLQVIVNDLHSQIESLNEDLVRMLLDRDDLHMEQDSMLVDIEDLSGYVGAKDQALSKSERRDVGKKAPKKFSLKK